MVQNMHFCKGNTSMGICSNTYLRTERQPGRWNYAMASQRNGLEEQRGNLRYGLERLAPPVRAYYLGNIAQLDAQIGASKKATPDVQR